MIETICSNCGNIRVFEDSYAGRKFKCPECGEVVEIKPTETKDVETKDETSNDSVETMVTKKRQELSDAEKKLANKEKKEQKKREKEGEKIEKELQKRLEFSLGQFKREKTLAYVLPLLYVAAILYVYYDPTENLKENWFISLFNMFVGLYCLGGWLIAGIYVARYRDHKKGWFGGSNDCVFTEDCKEATRKNIIHEMFPEREMEEKARQDAEMQKQKIQLEKILYELDHPEEKE